MWERRDRREGGLNHSSTKENTLICIRPGQASVTYKSAGLHITHRDSYSAFSTTYLHTSYFLFFLSFPLFLYSILVGFKSQPSPPNHHSVLMLFTLPILSSSSSVHLVIFSLIIPFPHCCPPSTLLSLLVASLLAFNLESLLFSYVMEKLDRTTLHIDS